MMKQVKTRIITQDDLIKAGCFDFNSVMDIIERTLVDYAKGKIIFPDKVSVIFNQQTQDRINCLPAAILPQNVYGMKWISVFPENPKSGRQNQTAVIVLSELEHGFPIAFMDGLLESHLRTSSIGAIAAKYLAKQNSKTIGFIGTGELAKAHLMSMKSTFPKINRCFVSSRTAKSEHSFIELMSKKYPDIEFIDCKSNHRKAVESADIIVTAISGQEKILQPEWIKDGAFYCHVAGLEDDYGVALKASKIVVDDWDVVKHRTQTISRMYKEGILHDRDIYANLHEIITGRKHGRDNDTEFIYFNSVGLSFIDIAVANWMYGKVIKAGLGTEAIMQDKSIFDYATINI